MARTIGAGSGSGGSAPFLIANCTVEGRARSANAAAAGAEEDAVGIDEPDLAIRGARNEFFPGAKPAATLLGVAALFDPEALIEIEVIAVRRPS